MAISAAEVTLVTVDPGHFHAALFQKEMLPGVAARSYVYAPLGPDLVAHLNRVAQFNTRAGQPTDWSLQVCAGADYWERLLRERPGELVVLSGINRGKIDRIRKLVERGWHVLADKPWIIEPDDLPALERALEVAETNGVVAFDGMTQRFEITCLLQRELVNEPDIFGQPASGTSAQPAVSMESVHSLFKEVAGVPNRRPAWFFDIHQQGEGLTDVGTHLVDLVQWTLFPDQAVDYRRDIVVQQAKRWPTMLSRAEFQRVTGETAFPAYLSTAVTNDQLRYFANTSVRYTIRGIQTRLVVRWEFQTTEGAADTEWAVFRGTRSSIEVRQGKPENYVPEVYVVPSAPARAAKVRAALRKKIQALQTVCPGLAMDDQGTRLRLVIPVPYRIGHEAHFGRLTRAFLDYLRDPKTLPAWEKPNMLAKYYVTTRGIELARLNRDNTPEQTQTNHTP